MVFFTLYKEREKKKMSVKTIRIGGNEYDLKSSAFTMFEFKDETGRDLLPEIADINNMLQKAQKMDAETEAVEIMNITGQAVQRILKIAYIMIKECNPNFKEFSEFAKELDGLMDDVGWAVEVLQLATAPFQRRIFTQQ